MNAFRDVFITFILSLFLCTHAHSGGAILGVSFAAASLVCRVDGLLRKLRKRT
jgi:hypothetical protein